MTAAEQPLLFEAIQRLCTATGARQPSAIEVDCEPNAHARFDRLVDVVRGGRATLVLRIGLPLAAGLSARQLLGVVGHELGHFNQRRGMAGSHLIRRLTRFLARVVFARDRIDQAVARLRRRRSGLARLAFAATFAGVEPMRGVLWLLMVGGELISCAALRRMEHDADDVGAHVAGVADFARTSKLLLFLGVAHHRALADLVHARAHHRLADDLPRLIVANAKQLREHRADLLRRLDADTTGWLDTHPCHADRVAHVRRLGAVGLFDADLPAKQLFEDFPGLCRRATSAVYAGLLSADDLAAARVVPTDELAAERATQRAGEVVLRRYFGGHVVPGRPIFPVTADVDEPVTDVAAVTADLAAARQAVADGARSGNALATTIRRYAEASVVVPILRAQLRLCSALPRNPRSNRVAARASRGLAEHESVVAETTAILAAFERPARERLTLALQLMGIDAVADRLGRDAAAGRAGVRQLTDVCAALAAALPAANRLQEALPTLRVFHAAHNPNQPVQPLVREIRARSDDAVAALRHFQSELAGVAYPFAHGTAGATVAAHVVRHVPDPRNPSATYNAASGALERYHALTFRSLSVLTQWAELAEGAVDLPPLPEAFESTDESADDPVADAAARRSRRYCSGYGVRAAAGLAMVASLVWLSVSPPALPAIGGGPTGAVRYRPAAFSASTAMPLPRVFLPTDWAPRSRAMAWGPPLAGYQGRTIQVQPTIPPTFSPPTPHMPDVPSPAMPPLGGQFGFRPMPGPSSFPNHQRGGGRR